jgi:uncharacterized protein YjiS (DUF1127 family)
MMKVEVKENTLTDVCDALTAQNDTLASAVFNVPHQILSMLRMWNQRATTRASLANLDAQFLQDVGLSAKQAYKETRKPFWIK